MNLCLAYARLQKELKDITRNPLPNISAAPSPANILEWHYVLRGNRDSVYAGGVYHGTIVFPKDYPYKPPAIFIQTPNGRFKTGCRLCLSISDFHPESWNPLWGISPILLGVQSFFYEDTITHGALKGVSDGEKRSLATSSLEYNVKNSVIFRKLFPEYVQEYELEKRKKDVALAGQTEASSPADQEQSRALSDGGMSMESKVVAGIVVLLSILILKLCLL